MKESPEGFSAVLDPTAPRFGEDGEKWPDACHVAADSREFMAISYLQSDSWKKVTHLEEVSIEARTLIASIRKGKYQTNFSDPP